MEYAQPLLRGTLIRRYKRFLADIVLDDGRWITAHCPNTGSMLGCRAPGLAVWVSPADRPGRRLAWTWEIVEVAGGVRVGIHTGRANALVAEGIHSGWIEPIAGYDRLRAEVKDPEGGRADFLLTDGDRPPCWVEVKSVTLGGPSDTGLFPDAVSARASRHLRSLAARVQSGQRAALVFCVQRGDVERVLPADEIDPAYARALAEAEAAGVELYAYRAAVSPRGLQLTGRVAVDPRRRTVPAGPGMV